MDEIDSKILFELLKDGRASQRQIAEDIGISAQVLNYRLNRLIEDGVIRKFFLHVNPSVTGQMEEFAAFKSEKHYDGNVSVKLNCLEEITLYGFIGENREELSREIGKAAAVLGPPVMRYLPPQAPLSAKPRELDMKILDLLKKDPRMSVSNIASDLGEPFPAIRRRLKFMKENRIFSVITQINLSAGSPVLYSIFSKSLDQFPQSFYSESVFTIRDSNSGFSLLFANTLKEARATVTMVREKDPSAEVMVLYDYEFYR